MADSAKSVISSHLLARNAVWNFSGLAAPMLVGVVTIPLLIKSLGAERFGLLVIIWMGIGYFSLFDIGLGRALTKLVAERLGSERVADLGPLLWTALAMILALGLTGGILVGIGAGPIVFYFFNVEPALQHEAIAALQILAVGLPAVVVTSALIGLLEAHQRFIAITAVRIPLGVLTFVAPLATAYFTPSLIWATWSLLGARLAALIVYALVAASSRPELKRPAWPCREHIRPLFQFGTWLTVSNIIGPMMVYFDRLFIGAIMTMTAVTYYATPFEVLSRVQLLPAAMMGVLFPALATAMMADRERLVMLYNQGTWILFLLLLPVFSGFFLLAPEALQLWLGEDFRQVATPVVYWLALGWLINGLARMPITALQSTGRPDLVAKTHLLELGPYIVVLWLLTRHFGIAGTAAAWFLRVLADTVILNVLVQREIPDLAPIARKTQIAVVGVVGGFALGWLVDPLLARALLLTALTVTSLAFLWYALRRLLGVKVGEIRKTPVAEDRP